LNAEFLKKRGEKPLRTAQLSTLAAFPPWGSSTGAGRMALTSGKCKFIGWIVPIFQEVFLKNL